MISRVDELDICVDTHIYTYIHTYVHIHTYTCIHTHEMY